MSLTNKISIGGDFPSKLIPELTQLLEKSGLYINQKIITKNEPLEFLHYNYYVELEEFLQKNNIDYDVFFEDKEQDTPHFVSFRKGMEQPIDSYSNKYGKRLILQEPILLLIKTFEQNINSLSTSDEITKKYGMTQKNFETLMEKIGTLFQGIVQNMVIVDDLKPFRILDNG